MTSLAESLISSSSRSLSVRKRPDLRSSRHQYQGTGYWVVKEPVGLQYFRFHEEEYFILQMLDGHVSLDQIKEGFEAKFAPQKITFGDLQQFIGMLHRSGLVISNSPGQGRALQKRGTTKKRKEFLGKAANIFALRFRGFDPEGVLKRITPWTGWLFTVPALICALLLMCSAGLLLATQFDTFYAKLPSFQQFFAADRWLYLAVTMAFVKVLHEFGHGISCKKFGGECHELGFMLLVFTPCLYCNVSDSWMLPNKWKRVWIGAAGIYVEMILASIATFLWWFSEPGLLNDLCLNMMFLNAVSTIVVNGNPLLRFDGYYILMDILEIPNLRQKATEILKRKFQEICLGLELQEDPFLPRRNQAMFALYTIASVIYRWVVVFSICWFLIKVLEPYGLAIVGRMVAVAGFSGMIIQPIWQSIKFLRTPGRFAKVKKGRLAVTLSVVAAIIAAVCFVPLPHHVDCAFQIEPVEATNTVYAGVQGRIGDVLVKAGTPVIADLDTIAVLENPELMIQLEELRGQKELAILRRRTLERLMHDDRNAAASQQLAEDEQIESLTRKIAKLEDRVARLTIKAPCGGIVMPPPEKQPQGDPEEQLPSWTGTPLDPENKGALLNDADVVCLIGDPNALEAVLVLDQGDRNLVTEGMDVDLKFDAARNLTFYSKMGEVSESPLNAASMALSSQTGGDLQTEIDPATGQPRPRSVSYQVRVPLDVDAIPLRIGYRGSAKIHTEPKSLGWRLWRIITQTFNFEL
ncbi:hemolysin D [Planctomycetaceae bacterium SH139]